MKTKLLILFFTLLSLPQASWSQRVDNGTEGLALVDASTLAKPTEVETLLAAFEKGSMPSESFLKSFTADHGFVYRESSQPDLRNFRINKYFKKNFKNNFQDRGFFIYYVNDQGNILPKASYIKLDYDFRNLSGFMRSSWRVLFSENYNSLISNKYLKDDDSLDDGWPYLFIREYMNTLIVLEVRYLDDNELRENKIPENRVYNQFSTDTKKAVISKIIYLFKLNK